MTLRRGMFAVLMIAVLAVPFVVWPDASFAADRYNYRGASATANFQQSDISGCIVMDIQVFASDAVSKTGNTRYLYSWAYVYMYEYDYCQNSFLREINGSVELAPSEFTVTKNLASASLKATIPVHHVTLGHWGTVWVDLAWTATGVAYHGVSHYRDRAPGFMMNNHSVGTQRSAEASGAIWDAEGDYARGVSEYANISNTQSGTIYIVK